MNFDKDIIKAWSEQGPKKVFGDVMLDACAKNKDVVILSADLAKAMGVYCVLEKFPEQYYNLGICEQNMIGVAGGLAKEGKIPVTSSFVPFLTLRACEQIRSGVAYMNLNVKMVGGNAGVKGGKAASTHYGLEDMAVLRTMPNMTVLSPSDGLSMYKAMQAMIEHVGPVYMRLTGINGMRVIYDGDFDYRIGKAVKLLEGDDVMIFATGSMVAHAQDAIDILRGKGVCAGLYDMHTIKPLDTEAISSAAAKAKLIVTIEEHTVIGGLGGAVAEVLAQAKTNARLKIMGLKDEFLKIAPYHDQLKKCNLMPDQIAEAIAAKL